jgi:aminodeoxyfutalosine deaminase
MPSQQTISLRARYLFPISKPPLQDGWITICDGRIVAVGGEPIGERRDLGDVALLPGLVNAHTHLEFSSLAQPLGEAGMPFPEWILEVIRWRQTAIEQHEGSDWRSDPIRQGLSECSRSGVAAIGEIATLPWREADHFYETAEGVAFLELLGLAEDRHDELLASATDFLRTLSAGLMRRGISPHAPYTVGLRLVESIASLSAANKVPVAMHLAETRDELELLREGSGPFRELLERLGAWHTDAIPRDSRPLDYMKRLSKADRSLIVHGNYLERDEIAFAGEHRSQMSIVYCPRTHAYFDHDDYPLQEMLECGVRVALGTDSCASNPDLDLLAEARFAARQHSNITLASILRMVTVDAAIALGCDNDLGTLTPGKRADIIAIPISSEVRTDPHELLFDSDACPTCVAGIQAFR